MRDLEVSRLATSTGRLMCFVEIHDKDINSFPNFPEKSSLECLKKGCLIFFSNFSQEVPLYRVHVVYHRIYVACSLRCKSPMAKTRQRISKDVWQCLVIALSFQRLESWVFGVYQDWSSFWKTSKRFVLLAADTAQYFVPKNLWAVFKLSFRLDEMCRSFVLIPWK